VTVGTFRLWTFFWPIRLCFSLRRLLDVVSFPLSHSLHLLRFTRTRCIKKCEHLNIREIGSILDRDLLPVLAESERWKATEHRRKVMAKPKMIRVCSAIWTRRAEANEWWASFGQSHSSELILLYWHSVSLSLSLRGSHWITNQTLVYKSFLFLRFPSSPWTFVTLLFNEIVRF
jgi:hypothetical protein